MAMFEYFEHFKYKLVEICYFYKSFEDIFAILNKFFQKKIKIKIHKLKYFKEVWNILDVCILLICYICIIFNIYRTIKVNTLLDGLLKDSTQFVDFSDLAYAQNMFNQAIAITAFMSWVKVK